MEMTNMQADMILGQLNTIYASLTKSAEPAPCTLTFGLAKTIRKCQTELKEYFEEKQKLLQKYDITTDAQISGTENGQKFLAEFNPLSMETSEIEFHKLRMTFDELCDVMENYSSAMIGDPMILQLICKDESENEDEDQKEGE